MNNSNNIKNQNKTNTQLIEQFESQDITNGCHYACSSINWLNIFLLIIIVILLYQCFQK